MTIDVSAVYGATATSATTSTTASNGDLDKQAFLNLLVAQLRNQDPSNPMDSSDLMAQTTQLTTMERLIELSDTSRESFALQMRMAASGLVGQQVSYIDADGATKTGTVSAVSYLTAVPTVTVGDVQVPLDSISAVATPGTTTTPPATDTDTDTDPA